MIFQICMFIQAGDHGIRRVTRTKNAINAADAICMVFDDLEIEGCLKDGKYMSFVAKPYPEGGYFETACSCTTGIIPHSNQESTACAPA